MLCCRFCMGSTRVLQVAMGRTEADEYKANLSQLTERVRGNVGLFFTKLPRHEARGMCTLHCCCLLQLLGSSCTICLCLAAVWSGRPVTGTALVQYNTDPCHNCCWCSCKVPN